MEAMQGINPRAVRLLLVLAAGVLAAVAGHAADSPLDRTILPVRAPDVPAQTEFDARDATMPPRFEVSAPDGAPNVVVVLIDDLGFGATETFGGPIATPTLERLAACATTTFTPRHSVHPPAPR